jgi:hypothetical protein
MVEGRGCDLQIGVGEDVACSLEMSPNLPEHAGNRDVEGKSGYRWENTFFDVPQMALSGRGAVGSLEEFTDRYGAGELVFSGNGLEPAQVLCSRMGAEQF